MWFKCEVLAVRGRRAALAALVLAGGSAFHAGAWAQWTQGGYDQGKSYANSVEKTLKRSNVPLLAPLWTATLDSTVASEVTQVDGRAFVCGYTSSLRALQPATGQPLWTRTLRGVGRCSAPALADGTLYVANSNERSQNWLSAFDQATGQPLWDAALTPSQWNFGPYPLIAVDAQRVYAAMAFDHVAAVNRGDGSIAWQTVTDTRWSDMTDLSVGAGHVFVSGSYSAGSESVSMLTALDAATGNLAWSIRIGGNSSQFNVYNAPMIVGDKVYVITAGGQLFSYDIATGTQTSSLQLRPSAFMAAYHDDRLWIVGDSGRTIQAVDLANNQVLWTRTAGQQNAYVTSNNIVWANHQLYAVVRTRFGDSMLAVYRASDGRDAARIALPAMGWHSILSVADGRVFMSTGGTVQALGL